MFDFPNSPALNQRFTVAGITYEWNGTGWRKIAALSSLPMGQCRLTKLGANLQLVPYNGNKLLINGAQETIPDIGVALAPTGTVGTTPYIYAYMSGSSMALEASTTTFSVQAGTGVKVKSTDPTRTLVGKARVGTGTAWFDDEVNRLLLSYYNRVRKHMRGAISTPSTGSTSYIELDVNARIFFLSWGEDAVDLKLTGICDTNTAGPSITSFAKMQMDAADIITAEIQ